MKQKCEEYKYLLMNTDSPTGVDQRTLIIVLIHEKLDPKEHKYARGFTVFSVIEGMILRIKI